MDIKVEKKERRNSWWLLPVVGLGALALALGIGNRNDDDRQAGYYNTDRPAVVSYQGRRWTPADRAVVLDDDNVREVGRTSEGYSLFAPVGGGGGGKATNQYYLKADDDRYVPVTAR